MASARVATGTRPGLPATGRGVPRVSNLDHRALVVACNGPVVELALSQSSTPDRDSIGPVMRCAGPVALGIWAISPWAGQCDPVGSIPALDLTSTVIRRPAGTGLLGTFLAALLTAIVVLGQMT